MAKINGDGVSPDLDVQQRTQAGTTGGVSMGSVRAEDIGEAERATKENLSESGILFSNQKRTYDEYQEAGLTAIKQNQRVFEQSAAQLQTQLAQLNNISMQHLQNGVTIANEVNSNTLEVSNKTNNRAGRHEDVAIDGHWNPVQQGAGDAMTARAVTLDDVSLKAIAALVVAKMAESE